ncbi:MAG TPA: biosynthetic peptidoglycan transglycosylase [Solirubrobacteraceae bacterium]|nr:biosynthetic peptidoglycan transglycosylase [Solirubrobacteraceae bacterium]
MKLQQHGLSGGWLLLVRRVVLIVVGVVLVLFAAGAVYLLTLPGVGDVQRRAERIMRAHGESVAVLPTPPKLVDAVVSVEDEHFFDNAVINVLTGAGRAAVATLQTSQDPGGSTIDQQLAKQLYGRGQGVASTLREIGLGVKIAAHYSKHQILEMYLNVVYYGNGDWGVQQAATGYFHASPSQLTWAEASMLAGLPDGRASEEGPPTSEPRGLGASPRGLTRRWL